MEAVIGWIRALPAAWLTAGLMVSAVPHLLRLLAQFVRSGQQLHAVPAVLHRPAAWFQPLRWTVLSSTAAGLAAALSGRSLPLVAAVGSGLLLGCLVLCAAAAVTRRQAQRQLDLALTPAIGRLSALLSGGIGLRAALERTLSGLDSPLLTGEWQLLLREPGRPLPHGGVVTLRQVLTAVAHQTLSARHAVFLLHMAAALEQPHDVLARRCAAAYAALQASARRRAEAQAELAQMRYSGLAIGLAGLIMAGYLTVTQWPRVLTAYGTADGRWVALFVGVSLIAPLIGAYLFSEVADVDY